MKAIVMVFAIALLSGCKKPEENSVPPPPVSNVQFEGVFLLNGKEVDNPWPRFSYDNSIADSSKLRISFTEYVWIEGDYWPAWWFYTDDFLVGNTTMFAAIYSPETFRVYYGLQNMDALRPGYVNDTSGYFYAEQRDSLSFFVDLEAPLIQDVMPEKDTIEVKVKGVFTRKE